MTVTRIAAFRLILFPHSTELRFLSIVTGSPPVVIPKKVLTAEFRLRSPFFIFSSTMPSR